MSNQTSTPNLAKPTTAWQCQSIFFNLVKMMDRRGEQTASIFIHELGQTERCDKYHDLQQLREDYDTYQKQVAEGNPDRDFAWVAGATVAHYGDRTHRQLTKALDKKHWLRYNIVYEWERTLGELAFFAGGAAGARLVGKSVAAGRTRAAAAKASATAHGNVAPQ
jgi:hypothetical protein